MDKINWNEIAEDLVLIQELINRFESLGCNADDSITLASRMYMEKESVIINTSDGDQTDTTTTKR